MSHTTPNHADSGYEKSDTNIKTIVTVSLISILVVVAIVVTLGRYFVITQEQIYQEQVLQTEPHELIALRSHEDSVLSSTELLDTQNQTYRIPIGRAMELIVEESAGTPAGN